MTIPATTTLDLNLLQMMLDDIEDSIYIMKVTGAEITYYYVNNAATKFSGITMDQMGTSFLNRIRAKWQITYIKNMPE